MWLRVMLLSQVQTRQLTEFLWFGPGFGLIFKSGLV